MKVKMRLPAALHDQVQADLSRPHPFAFERAGFIAFKPATTDEGLLLSAAEYLPLQDDWYVEDSRFGCEFNSRAMQAAMQMALRHSASIFHVHQHDHDGPPSFSRPDLSESKRFAPDFWNVMPKHPHGTLLLSYDQATALCWIPGRQRPRRVDQIVRVGYPIRFLGGLP